MHKLSRKGKFEHSHTALDNLQKGFPPELRGRVKEMSEELIKEIKNVVVAYEPIWAIGTGKNATPSQAEEVHKFIKGLLSKMYNAAAAKNTRIIYGGSMKPNNAKELLSMPNINGGLIGGASLDAKSFGEICGVRG